MCRFILIIFIFVICSCQSQIDLDKRTEGKPPTDVVEVQTSVESSTEVEAPTTVESSNYLVGTKWKLEGLVDAETGDLEILEPKDCADCYTLMFDADTTAQGKAIVNHVFLTSLNPIKIQCGTYALECIENQGCNYYCDLLKSVTSYDANESELILYLSNQNYLLFKIIKT